MDIAKRRLSCAARSTKTPNVLGSEMCICSPQKPSSGELLEIVSRFQYDLIYNMYFPCGLFSGDVRIHSLYRGRYINNYENSAFVVLVSTFSWHFARTSSH
jgi:hypothetical protein